MVFVLKRSMLKSPVGQQDLPSLSMIKIKASSSSVKSFILPSGRFIAPMIIFCVFVMDLDEKGFTCG